MVKLKESFSWLTPEAFKVESTGPNTVKIKGVAIPQATTSKNKRYYIDEEMIRAARTWIGKPFNVNHDNRRIIGNVDWMEYDNGAMEYLVTVKKQPFVDMLRNHDERIKGVSIEADYLYNRCRKCGDRFYDAETFITHMHNDHGLEVSEEEPHGIKGSFLSLVVSPEEPGVEGTTFELYETLRTRSPMQLLETVTKNKKEEENEMRKKLEKANIATKLESRTTIGRIREQEEGQLAPAHPTEEGGHECPVGSHWDEVAGTCVHDIVQGQDTTPPATKTAIEQEEDHGCGEGEHWDGEKCVANVEEQEDHECPEGEHWNGTKCVANVTEQDEHGCGPDEHWDAEKEECVPHTVAEQEGHCPPGFKWDEVEGTCVAEEIPEEKAPVNAPQFVAEPPIEVPKVPVETPAPAVGTKVVSEQVDGQLPDAPFPTEPTSDPSVTKKCPVGSHWDEVASTCVPDLIPEVTTGEAPVEKGGVTVGEIKLPKLLTLGEPFANYTDFADCVSKNADKDNPEAYCADIKRKTEGDTVNESLKVIPAVHEMDVRLTAENIQIAETLNTLNVATAYVIKHIQGLPKREQARIIAEASLRNKGDKAIVAWTKKVISEVQKGTLKLSETERLKLQEQLGKMIHKISETYTIIDAVQKNASKTSEKNHNKLLEYIQKKMSGLATQIGKDMALIKKQSATIRRLDRQLLKESGLNKRQCTTINSLKEQQKVLTKQVGNAGKQFEELQTLRTEFKKFKEQEDAKPEACPEGQHRNEQGECVPDEEPEVVKELKETVTKLQTDMDNMQSKLGGKFKSVAPKLKETQGDGEYFEDDKRTGSKRNKRA